jgi:hypothetical protein
MDFIQIGTVFIAIAHIGSIRYLDDGTVDIYEPGDGAAWHFYGEEAKAVKKWLVNRTNVLVAPEQPAVATEPPLEAFAGLSDACTTK